MALQGEYAGSISSTKFDLKIYMYLLSGVIHFFTLYFCLSSVAEQADIDKFPLI